MAIDGILLSKMVPEVQAVLPLRIQKIYEISNTEVLFQVHGAGGKKQLLISCHSVYNRFLLTKRSYPTPMEPGNFVMVLRKYLEGSIIEEITQAGLDRWCYMKIRRHNDIGDLEFLTLYVELMGKYANIVLVNAEGKIIDALKRIPPFENSKRTIFPGAMFTKTPPQEKKNPFETFAIDMEIPLTKQFLGFSPQLSKEIEYRMSNGQSFQSIMQEIKDSKNLYISTEQPEQFHCIPLTMLGSYRSYPLFDGFDILYHQKEEKERIKQISGDIFQFVNRQIKHQKTKLPRLEEEYETALDCDKYRKYGDLLYTYQIQDTKGTTEIYLEDYETEEKIRVPLDPKLDGRGNANKAYTRYNKLKKGQVHLQEQIQICKDELSYFEGILQQLNQADFQTATEIREELIRYGYLKEKKNSRKKNKKKKAEEPHITTIEYMGTFISFGKNNLQNETLTWHKAKKNEIWMHAKDYHGAHLVIHDDHPSEDVIRMSAMIAAYYSAGRQSSSVPVIWCPVKNLKKIPGAKPGMVQLGSYRTIYIDPEPDTIQSLGLE